MQVIFPDFHDGCAIINLKSCSSLWFFSHLKQIFTFTSNFGFSLFNLFLLKSFLNYKLWGRRSVSGLWSCLVSVHRIISSSSTHTTRLSPYIESSMIILLCSIKIIWKLDCSYLQKTRNAISQTWVSRTHNITMYWGMILPP